MFSNSRSGAAFLSSFTSQPPSSILSSRLSPTELLSSSRIRLAPAWWNKWHSGRGQLPVHPERVAVGVGRIAAPAAGQVQFDGDRLALAPAGRYRRSGRTSCSARPPGRRRSSGTSQSTPGAPGAVAGAACSQLRTVRATARRPHGSHAGQQLTPRDVVRRVAHAPPSSISRTAVRHRPEGCRTDDLHASPRPLEGQLLRRPFRSVKANRPEISIHPNQHRLGGIRGVVEELHEHAPCPVLPTDTWVSTDAARKRRTPRLLAANQVHQGLRQLSRVRPLLAVDGHPALFPWARLRSPGLPGFRPSPRRVRRPAGRRCWRTRSGACAPSASGRHVDRVHGAQALERAWALSCERSMTLQRNARADGQLEIHA